MSSLDRKTRNQVKKSLKFGFETRLLTKSNIDDIHNLHKANMIRFGSKIRDKQFFLNLFDFYKDKIKFLGVFDKNKLIGVMAYTLIKGYSKLIILLSKQE